MDHSLDSTAASGPATQPAADRPRDGSAGRRRRERYGLLLAALVAAFAVQGTATPGPWEEVAISALLATTLLLALWAAEARPRVMRPALAISAAVLIASIVEAASGSGNGAAPRLANLLLVVLAPPAIVVGVVRSLRARGAVTVEAVFGVLCLYLLIGMGFALVYEVLANLSGQFFAGGTEATTPRCLYFSFTTLTTVGYGDLTAETNVGHTLSVTEALVGQIYLVTVVSLIVSNLRPRRRAS